MSSLNYSNQDYKALIVGENSQIVSEIKPYLKNFDFVSHVNIKYLNLDIYEKIFVFSWSHESLDDNLQLLEKFDLEKVVFISTISVLACVRRAQWAIYPNAKLVCEEHVLKGGGKIIRIGIWNLSHLDNLPGTVPITTVEILVDTINQCLISNKKIFWPIVLRGGKLKGIRSKIGSALNYISSTLPNNLVIQLPFLLASKFLRLKNYGYTYDCLQFFSERTLVGYGAVGSAISSCLTKKRLPHAIVVSHDENIFLNSNGFQGFRIGQFMEGLSNLWHGVWVKEDSNNMMAFKVVPLLVSRPRVPKKAIEGTAYKISFDLGLASVGILHQRISDVRVFSNVIHLATGVINNVKLLQESFELNEAFSDHEVVCLGVVKTQNLVDKGIIKRRLGFIFGRNIITRRSASLEYMIDFRPSGPNSIAIDGQNIYNNRLQQIIKKLIKNFSWQLINQAFFNKFGISFDVDEFSVVVQIEAPNCIKLTSQGQLSRSRLSKNIYKSIASDIKSIFPSFSPLQNFHSFDAIHVHSAIDLKKYPQIYELINKEKLFMHGNVFDGSALGPYHNTKKMIDREVASLANIKI
jgi:hypothetical protein